MSSAAGSMMTGLVIKAQTRPEIATDAVAMSPFGSTRTVEWTMPAHHLTGVLLGHLELDPGVTTSDSAAKRRRPSEP